MIAIAAIVGATLGVLGTAAWVRRWWVLLGAVMLTVVVGGAVMLFVVEGRVADAGVPVAIVGLAGGSLLTHVVVRSRSKPASRGG